MAFEPCKNLDTKLCVNKINKVWKKNSFGQHHIYK